MCGIAGFVNKSSSSEFGEDLLRRMGDLIAHRGPDAEGFLADRANGVGLANRRLSIIDIAGGSQPMANEDESIWITYNGEIYNFRELKNELEARGRKFKTHSDTEVVLRTYEEFGTDAFAKLNGIFAFAIYDKRNKKVVIVRDPFGVKPLYYFENSAKVLFGSEIRSIHADPSVERAVDANALNEFITFRYNPSPNTLFAGVRKLAPGHFVEIMRDGCSQPRSYLPECRPTVSSIDENEAIEEYRRLLSAAVKRQMISDVPLGLFLSGGVDSAAIGRLMMNESDRPISTYTVGFPGKGDFNELADARATVRVLGSEHHELTIGSREYLEFFARSFEVIEEPIAETSVSALYYLSRRAAQDVKVVLAGQGADEPMGGYHRYLGMEYIEKYGPLVAAAKPFVRFLPRNDRVKQAAYVAGHRTKMDRLMAVYSIYRPEQRKALLSARSANGNQIPDRLRELASEAGGLPDLLSKMMYIDTRMSLADDLLLFNDKVTMANSLEMRVPFLDLELVAFLETLPANLKVRGTVRKYIHKRAVEAWLPREIIHRKKRGFQTPMDEWLQSDLADAAKQLFEEKDSACRRYFNIGYVNELIEAHRRRRENHQRRLYALLCLELWHRSWIDRKPLDPAQLVS
jgi:asparagine synthase (glutamine-hydrolysing)